MEHPILIVEDNAALLVGIRALLRPLGRPLLAAATVAEARAHLAVAAPSHAIVDLNLPDGSGLDVINDLRARGLPTRVMILTGTAGTQHLAAVRAAAVDAVMTKPPDWDAVVRWAGRPVDGDPSAAPRARC